jgi:hypothetical protein
MEAHNFERNTAMNLRTTFKAMKLRTIVITGAVALACGAVLLLGMSSFAQQGDDVIQRPFILGAPVDAPKPPPEEPTEPESFSGLGSASLDVKLDTNVCVGANPTSPPFNICNVSRAGAVAATAGSTGLIRLVVQVRDQGGSPIDGLVRGNFQLHGTQGIPFNGPGLEIVPLAASIPPLPAPQVDLGFAALGHGIYMFFVRPFGVTAAGTPNVWVAGSYYVEVQAPSTGHELVQITIL